ncbi:MAG: hypothetical protein IPN86_19895 [Saprospiraceae bacterium]|nr:hypothetical protein [Saprospiraceae bacterium]
MGTKIVVQKYRYLHFKSLLIIRVGKLISPPPPQKILPPTKMTSLSFALFYELQKPAPSLISFAFKFRPFACSLIE